MVIRSSAHLCILPYGEDIYIYLPKLPLDATLELFLEIQLHFPYHVHYIIDMDKTQKERYGFHQTAMMPLNMKAWI